MNMKLAITKKNVIPLKLNPSFDSEVADESLYGMVLELEDELKDGWYRARTYYDYEGFVHEKDILIDNERAMEWSKMADHYIIHNIADVLAEPKYQSYQLITLVRGDFIHLTGREEDRWCEIELIDKTKGWVQKEFIKKMPKFDLDKEEDAARESILKTAFLYLGTQYRWGGKSPMGIDCSGLVSTAYLLNGITIYRDAKLKEKYMRSISLEEAKPADALYFPGHIAMYIGDGKYIHSTGSFGKVVIHSLNPEDDNYREVLHKSLYAVGTVFGRK